MKRFKTTYFYLAAYVSLSVLYWGLADLGRVILEYFWGKSVISTSYYSSTYLFDTFKRDVSLRLASIIVALPLWVFHWPKAIEDSPEESVLHRYHHTSDKRNYSLVAMGIPGIIILIAGIWLIYEILNVLLGVSNRQLKDFGMPLSYTTVSLVIWYYHFQVFKKVTEELKELRAKLPDTVGTKTKTVPSLKKNFCQQCGEKLTTGVKFCPGCGANVG